jgi:hypothetical protein
MIYTYDTTLGLRNNSVNHVLLIGGSGYRAASILTSAVFKIGSVARYLLGTTDSYAQILDSVFTGGSGQIEHYAQDDLLDPFGQLFSQSYVRNNVLDGTYQTPAYLERPYTLTNTGLSGYGPGSFLFFGLDPTGNQVLTYTFGNLTP